MRLQETFSEHTRDLSITRGVSAGYLDSAAAAAAGGGGTGGNVDDTKVKSQLDGNSDREKLNAMKKLIAVCPKTNIFKTFTSFSFHTFSPPPPAPPHFVISS